MKYSPEPFSPEKHTESPSPQALFKRYREQGSLDLRHASHQDRAKLATHLPELQENLSPPEQLELIEQLMQTGDLTDASAEKAATKLSEEEREYLTVFIISTLDLSLYPKTYYYCRENSSSSSGLYHLEQQRKEQGDAKDLLTLAPYTVLSNHTIKSDTNAHHTALDTLTSHYNTAQQLLKNLLDAHQAQPEESRHISYRTKGNIEEIKGNHPKVLLEQLPELMEHDLITPEQFKHLFSRGRLFYLASPTPDLFTTEEAEQLKAYEETIDQQMGVQETSYNIPFPDQQPRHIAIQRVKLREKAIFRNTKRILEHIHTYADLLPQKPIDTLKALWIDGAPIFAHPEDLHLTKQEMLSLLVDHSANGNYLPYYSEGLGDIPALLTYDRAHPEPPSIEEFIVKNIHKELKKGHTSYEMEVFVIFAQDILPHFQSEHKNQLIEAITERKPGLWAHNIPFALENGISFETILEGTEKTYGNPGRWFTKLYYHAKQLPEHISREHISTLRQLTLRGLERYPREVFSTTHAHIINAVLSPEEKRQFIEKHLASAHSEFLFHLLRSKEFPQYKRACAELVERHPHLVAYSTRDSRTFKHIEQLLPLNLLLHILKEQHEDVDWETVIDTWSVFQNPEHPQHEYVVLQVFDQPEAIVHCHDLLTRWDKEHPTDTHLISLRKKVLQKVQAHCQKDPSLIFEGKLLTFKTLSTESFVEPHLEDQLNQHPELLLTAYYSQLKPWQIPFPKDPSQFKQDRLTLKARLGNERFNRLLHKHRYALAFDPDRTRLPKNDQEQLEEINLLSSLEKEDNIPGGYYQAAIDKLKPSPFFPLFKESLQNIAAQEQTLHGLQKDMIISDMNPEFLRQAEALMLLNVSPIAQIYAKELLGAPSDEQQHLIQIIAKGTKYNLFTDLDPQPTTSLQVLLPKMEMAVGRHFQGVFELESESTKETFEHVDTETLEALKVYYYNICKKEKAMKDGAQTLLKHVFGGTYETWHEWGIDQTPTTPEAKEQALSLLKKKRLLPQNITLEQYEAWLSAEHASVKEALALDLSGTHQGIQEILQNSAADHHLPQEMLEMEQHEIQTKYDQLIQPIHTLSQRKKALAQRFAERKKRQREQEDFEPITPQEEAEYARITKKIQSYQKQHGEKIRELEALQYVQRMRHISSVEIEQQQLQIDQKIVPWKKVFQTLRRAFTINHPDFVPDIARLETFLTNAHQDLFEGTRISRKNLEITDKPNLKESVFIGEKPVPSCQNYASNTGYNAGLLSYLSDPNVRIIRIHNDQGEMVARSVLRLLEDTDGNPQLFLEEIYSVNPHPHITEAIASTALKKAAEMGCYAYTTTSEPTSDSEKRPTQLLTPTVLSSHASRSGHVYTDAGGGLSYKGTYTIAHPAQLT